MRANMSALLILLLTCAHGPLSAAMPHDFEGSHHSDNGHHAPHQHEHEPLVVSTVEAADASSSQTPASTGHHQHLVADAVSNHGVDAAMIRLTGMKTSHADDNLLAQSDPSILLEPPIA
jgi:hypothetical protein